MRHSGIGLSVALRYPAKIQSLYVIARRDDLIFSGGENIYPAEVEAVQLEHPAIAEAGVFGIADSRWGQLPVAAIRLREGVNLSAEELRAFCGVWLARYEIPIDFWFVDVLSPLPPESCCALHSPPLGKPHSPLPPERGES